MPQLCVSADTRVAMLIRSGLREDLRKRWRSNLVSGCNQCMGAWGTGIFQDDTACDIRDGYRDYLGEGLSGPEATARILKELGAGSLADPHEAGVVWMALAAVQWKHGRLEDETKKRALSVIESGTDLERWKGNSKDLLKRKSALEKLRVQITSPQPPSRKVPRRILCESRWREGDLFGYRLLDGRLVLFNVVGHHTDKGGKYPICHLLDWIGEELPRRDVIQSLEVKPSRPDNRHSIKQIMLVGLKQKSARRLIEVDVRVTTERQKTPSSVVHFKHLDKFLKDWFLIG